MDKNIDKTEIGQRIVAIRKAKGITQVQLATALNTSKKNMCSYEKGHRKVPLTLLAPIAEVLGVSTDEIIGVKATVIDGRGQEAKLMKRFQKISNLPDEKRKTVVHVLDTLLADAK